MEQPDPEPGYEDAIVRITAAGVCHSDVHLFKGGWTGVPRSGPSGYEGIGIVEALRPGGERYGAVGDRVIVGLGGSGGGYWCGACEHCLGGRPRLCRQSKGILTPCGSPSTGATRSSAWMWAPTGSSSCGASARTWPSTPPRRPAWCAPPSPAACTPAWCSRPGSPASAWAWTCSAGAGCSWRWGSPPTRRSGIELSPWALFGKDPLIMFSAVGSVQDMRELVQLAVDGHIRTHVSRTGPLSELPTILDELDAARYTGRAVITDLSS